MCKDQRQSVLACFRQDGRKTVGGKMLELIGVQCEIATLAFRNVGARFRGLCKGSGQECAQEMRRRFTKLALGEIDDEDLSAVHDVANIDGALDLTEHVADRRWRQ